MDQCSAFGTVLISFPHPLPDLLAARALSSPRRSGRPSGHSSCHPTLHGPLIWTQADLPGSNPRSPSPSSISLAQPFTLRLKLLRWGDPHISFSGKDPSSSGSPHTSTVGIITQHLPTQPCAECHTFTHALGPKTTQWGGPLDSHHHPRSPVLTPPQPRDTGSWSLVCKTEGTWILAQEIRKQSSLALHP